MKVKAKLDLQAIKNLALEHGEKVAFAVVGVIFLLFVYSALKRESLSADKQPDQLQAKAQQVQTHVSQSKFDAGTAQIALVDYVDRAKREVINVDPYKPPRALNDPVFDQKPKRDNPTILPLEELRAGSGFGMFALSGAAANDGNAAAKGGGQVAGAGFAPGPDASIVGCGYTVITGLVPYKKQSQDYAQRFDAAQAADISRDRPRYARLIVERAEIDPAQPDKLDWQPVPDSSELVNRFAGLSGDVIPLTFRQEELAAELGPLVRRPWGETVNHPRISAAIAQSGETADAGKQQQARPVAARAAVEEMMPRNRRGGAANPVVAAQPDSDVEYRLCRFFDYAVAPKKQYRYRAKAVLHNPNFGVAPQYLTKPETSTVEFLETEWSNPTGTVTVPDRYGVLAQAVGEKWHRDEPSVKLLATAIDEKAGIEAGAEVDVYRASVVNLTAPKVDAVDPRDQSMRTLENVDLNTGIVVVDIHGGGPLSRKIGSTITGPVEVLVMDAQGNLRVRGELADRTSIGLLVPPKRVDVDAKAKQEKTEKGKKPNPLEGMPTPAGKAKATKAK